MYVDAGLPFSSVTPQEVAIGAASAQSAAVDATTGSVLLTSTSDCRILLGTNPTALATSTLLPAGIPLPVKVQKGKSWKVAVIQETAAGKLSITEMLE